MKSILLIEDDESIRTTLSLILEDMGYLVATGINGKDGLEKLAEMKEPPCVVLLDLMMPVMNGWEFLSECEKNNLLHGIPIIVISAFGKGVKLGRQVTFLHKPIELDEITQICEKHCPVCKD